MGKKVLVAYIPVLHQGYRMLFDHNPSFRTLYILDDPVLDSSREIQKDIRRLAPKLVRQSLVAWNLFDEIHVADSDTLQDLNQPDTTVLMPDEDISRLIAENFLSEASVQYSPIFLRWDRHKSNAEDPIDDTITVSQDQLAASLLDEAAQEAARSSDIWRRVGALIVKDGKVLSKSHNQATPTVHSSWMYGDPRNNYSKGVGIEKSVFIHAEARLIGEAAKQGQSLEGADMYVTTFPCPPCAMLIAESGIRQLFFSSGYAVLDGRNILEAKGIKIIRVEGDNADTSASASEAHTNIPYPEK